MRGTTVLYALAYACVGGCAMKDASDEKTAETPAVEATTSPAELIVDAADFAFGAPDTVPAGWTTIRLRNGGPSLHHVQLVRVDDGHTYEELLGAASQPGPAPAWAHEVGGPNTPPPGGESVGIVKLEPGVYAIACFIPDDKGVPHIALGMVRQMVVTGTAAGAEPASDAEIRLSDYAFQTTAPLTAGRHTIRVINDASQHHEMFIARLAPGKTAMDLAAWAEHPDGPPPGEPIGGTSGIEPGGVNYVSVDLAPGEYALLCFLPDAGDGAPHVAHGMARQISVAG